MQQEESEGASADTVCRALEAKGPGNAMCCCRAQSCKSLGHLQTRKPRNINLKIGKTGKTLEKKWAERLGP